MTSEELSKKERKFTFVPCHHCNKKLKRGTVISHYKKYHPSIYDRIISEVHIE